MRIACLQGQEPERDDRGTCEDTCPLAEIMERCNTQDVPLFERTHLRVTFTITLLAVKNVS